MLIFGCGVKQPVENDNEQRQTGHLFVESDPSGAEIILDDTPTSQITPDTVKNIPSGKHVVKVYLNGFYSDRDSVIVQIQTDSVAHVFFQLQKILNYSTLNIHSEPEGALIYLNNQNTGKYTPDTLRVTPGSYQLRLVKNGFVSLDSTIETAQNITVDLNFKLDIHQRLLFESFANVSCIPCVNATENLHKFVEEHAETDFVIMEYFANWPNPNDPFYKAAAKDVNERVKYYNIQTLPTLKLNGAVGVDPGSYDDIVSKYSQTFSQQNNQIAISLRSRFSDNHLSVSVELFDYGNFISNSDLRLFVAITEDSIHFDSPPGSNGLQDFEWVFRGFLSPKEGLTLDSSNYNFEFDWKANWKYEHSKIIAFIQNINSKQIIQTTFN